MAARISRARLGRGLPRRDRAAQRPVPAAAEDPGRAAADVLAAGDEARLTAGSDEPERAPGRAARGLDELDEHPVARARVDERDRTLRPAARRRIDQLQAIDLEADQGLGQVPDLEADVVEP